MDKNQYLNLLTSVDVMNALNGGRTEPVLKLIQHPDSREIRVKIPGINAQKIQVEVNENRVAVFYMMNIVTAGKEIGLPHSVYNRQQPYYIDVGKIVAQVEGSELVITLPFNELANGYHRKIKTTED